MRARLLLLSRPASPRYRPRAWTILLLGMGSWALLVGSGLLVAQVAQRMRTHDSALIELSHGERDRRPNAHNGSER